MTDRLAALFSHFAVSARTFHTGALCGVNAIGSAEGVGQLHLVRVGWVEAFHGVDDPVRIDVPSLLLYPRAVPRRFRTDPVEGADMVCADLLFEGGLANPIVSALPDFVCMPLSRLPDSEPVLALLFSEAQAKRCGRQKMLDSLFEVLLVQVLRELMESRDVSSGLLAGMSHPKLRRALVAMHEQPSRAWSLEDLAQTAGMSRTVLANTFRDNVGITPGQYLLGWRMGLAQKMLREGASLRRIADQVGYGDEATLSRAFKSHFGQSPREWKKADEGHGTNGAGESVSAPAKVVS